MLIHEFDELMETKPFVPFNLVTADGRSVRIRSPEFAWHPPGSVRTVWVAKENGTAALVDLHHVTQAIVGANGKRRRK